MRTRSHSLEHHRPLWSVVMNGLRPLRWAILLALLSACGPVPPAVATSVPTSDASDAIPKKCWVFTHLNESGGTTVKEVLRQNWGRKFHNYSCPKWLGGNSHVHRIAEALVYSENYQVVGGGYTEALRRSSADVSQCQWFTVFRHPITRMVSAYFYCQKNPKDQTCASCIMKARQVDLITFAKHWGNYAMRQFVLSFLSIDDVIEYSQSNAVKQGLGPAAQDRGKIPGWYMVKLYMDNIANASNDGHVPDAALYTMLHPVQDLLRDEYTAVGILEEYNTTLSLFNTALGMPEVDWHETFATEGQENVNNEYKDEKAAALAEAWTNSDIKAYMQLDLLLYEHAVDILHQQVQAYGV